MSQFERTTFGLEAINTVNGIFEIEQALDLSVRILTAADIDPPGRVNNITLSSITTNVIYVDTGATYSLYLPDLSTVPIGTEVVIRTVSRTTIRGSDGSGNQIDNALFAALNFGHALTLYNDGTRWLILGQYKNSIPI